jgi:HSP20 family protein
MVSSWRCVMAGLLKREVKDVEPVDAFDRLDWMFDEWLRRMLPFRQSVPRGWEAEDLIRVDEFRENGSLVVRAELPGINPDKDVEVTVSGGMLHIGAERHEEEKTEEKGYLCQELRYGSFTRDLPLPEGVTEADVTASYRDGILEIRIPAPASEPSKRIPIATS